MDSMENKAAHTVIVVGAGWAGLAAALALSRQGHKVTILEAAPQAGGRARGVPFGKDTVDNGQHILMGAYTETLKLLENLEISEEKILYRTPFEWFIFNKDDIQKKRHIHKYLALSLLKRFSFSDFFRIMQFLFCVQKKKFKLEQDISVQDFLLRFKQSPEVIKTLWEPMALAALSTPTQQASAQVFVEILKAVLKNPKKNRDWLLPKVDLSTLLPNAIIEYIQKQQGEILYHQRAQKLIINNGKCTGIKTTTDEFYADQIILATPPHITAELLASDVQTNTACNPLIQNLLKFHYQPITTIYLRYQNPVNLPKPMMGLINSTVQWIFDRRFAGQPNILSAVITGTGPHSILSQAELINIIQQDLSKINPDLKNPIDYRVITEKRAAFSCDVGVNAYRPPHASPLPNLYLAGDYTQTRYPATLEGAIQSGVKAARLICSEDAYCN
jgi:squalene-associated FAD-dependent desaturase